MVFHSVFNSISFISQQQYQCFPGDLLTSTPHNILSSHWLLSHITVVETKNSSEREMNPVAMTIINPEIEYWLSQGSNQRPPVLKSGKLPTELWSPALLLRKIYTSDLHELSSLERAILDKLSACTFNLD